MVTSGFTRVVDSSVDVAVIGAGAAGLMCAIECGKRGRKVVALESAERIGNKIRISGGGRCNYTNRFSNESNFLSANPHFCRSALARFCPADMQALVDKHRIRTHEKKLGQMFCTEGSSEMIRLLEEECRAVGVEVRTRSAVRKISKSERFRIYTQSGIIDARSLVVSTGGLSIPKMGATGFGYETASQFGLTVVPTRPALVPLKWNLEDRARFTECAGVSVDCHIKCGGHEFRENILFTHHGLSGPLILQTSLYWQEGSPLAIDLLPGQDANEILNSGRNEKRDLHTYLSQYFPKRFARAWCESVFASKPLNQYTNRELCAVAELLHSWRCAPQEKDGYRIAEVTAGGVDTKELSSQTMESRKVSGLYFIGEVVDVTGQLGGHNFQWAWSSGFVAGQYA